MSDLINIGNGCARRGGFDTAKEFYLDAFSLARRAEDSTGLGRVLHNLSVVERDVGASLQHRQLSAPLLADIKSAPGTLPIDVAWGTAERIA